MPFGHIDHNVLEQARRTFTESREWRGEDAVASPRQVLDVHGGIAVLARAMIRCWAIRAALGRRFGAMRGLPASALSR
jgi:hypothetical protein